MPYRRLPRQLEVALTIVKEGMTKIRQRITAGFLSRNQSRMEG
jgi:hypothetical protein